MSFSNVTILRQKLESLSEDVREKFAEYLSEHFEDLKDELLEGEREELDKRLLEYQEDPTEGIEWNKLKEKLTQTK